MYTYSTVYIYIFYVYQKDSGSLVTTNENELGEQKQTQKSQRQNGCQRPGIAPQNSPSARLS